MKCKKCGQKLNSREMRSDGSIKCRACGYVNRVQAAPEGWEFSEDDERRGGFLSSIPWETRILGLPLRLWYLIGFGVFLALIVAAIALGINSTSGMDPTQGQGAVTTITTPAPTEVPEDAPVITVTQVPSDDATEPPTTAATVVPGAKSTGVTVSAFLERFRTGLSYLLGSGVTVTDAGADEGGNGRMMIDDTLSITYKQNASGEITSLTLEGRGDGTSASGTKQANALGAAIYGFDPSFVASNTMTAARYILEGNVYTGSTFTVSGRIVSGTGMTVTFAGK